MSNECSCDCHLAWSVAGAAGLRAALEECERDVINSAMQWRGMLRIPRLKSAAELRLADACERLGRACAEDLAARPPAPGTEGGA